MDRESLNIKATGEELKGRRMTDLTPKKGTITERKKLSFLRAISKSPNISLACKGAGISRETAYHWKRIDEDFSRSWDNSIEDSIDLLENEAFRRAKESSDVLAIFLLKAHRPQKYRERFELDLKNNPQFKAMVNGFAEVLENFVPRELLQSAVARFAALTGAKLDAEKLNPASTW